MASDTQKPKFGTVEVYELLANILNADPKWRDLAKPISYTMVYAYTAPIDKRFLLKFHQGEVVEVRDLLPGEEATADFVISGAPMVWRDLIQQKLSPTVAMASGKVKIKGSQAALLRHMKRFNYLISQLCSMDLEFS
ncbi:SCP2 sterol-binding domain-containing protein [Mycolicibacter kumamotonensis]|uniref:SCP2 sterol-binding domain-containing protein n=1 Tax=Mycolicibacter kumamotonensis TaxID=354243 RepID=A0A7K3LGE7_9MYCO|nr:SCP2 sterol-binding domain-containing protein [Mycolicibacter kumamotonensis]NDJ91403.1 SCP2 sterol-binding domain-containing protein [Mycolicibacter kumamotonensis]